MREVQFHFWGGEEADLAAAILANCLSRQGYKSKAAGTSVFASINDGAGEIPGEVFVVLNEVHLTQPSLRAQLDPGTAVIVSSARPARTLQQEFHLHGLSITTVDATGIASDEGSDPIAAALGGVARMLPVIDQDTLSTAIWYAYDRVLPYAARAAVRAMDLGYAQAQLVHG